jgi:phospholipid transport system substrate-binding protein
VKQLSQLLTICILSFACAKLFAHAGETPNDYLEGVANNMIQVLEKNKSSLKGNKALAKKIIQENLLPHIDQDKFSQKVLKNLWKSLNSQQQEKFKQAFVEQIMEKYAVGLELYDGQKFTFKKAKINTKGNALVSSKMKLASSESLTIAYYLTPHDHSWKIYNIVVDGIDIAKSYRNQFLPRIGEIGMEKFIQELNTPLKEDSKQ